MSDVSWPAGIDPVVPIPGYPNTWTHTPQRPAIARAPGRTELAAPPGIARKLGAGTVNLAERVPGRPAIGQRIEVAAHRGRGDAQLLDQVVHAQVAVVDDQIQHQVQATATAAHPSLPPALLGLLADLVVGVLAPLRGFERVRHPPALLF